MAQELVIFWGTEVKPGKECTQKIEPNQTLKVSGVAFSGTPKGERTIVQVSTGDKAYTVAVLKSGLQESTLLDIENLVLCPLSVLVETINC